MLLIGLDSSGAIICMVLIIFGLPERAAAIAADAVDVASSCSRLFLVRAEFRMFSSKSKSEPPEFNFVDFGVPERLIVCLLGLPSTLSACNELPLLLVFAAVFALVIAPTAE